MRQACKTKRAWPQLVDAVVTAQHDQRALTAELVGRSSLGWALYRKSPVKICFCNVLGIYPESVEHTGIELEFHKSKCWPREKMTKMVIGCHWRCSGVLPVVCDDDVGSGVLQSLSLVSEWGRSISAKQVVFLSNNWVVSYFLPHERSLMALRKTRLTKGCQLRAAGECT